jgi:pSer/pThr/pTyr-binding forkhead associated (FHA) protein
MTCTTCGRENPPHLTFCQECGQRLGPRIAPPTPPIGLGSDYGIPDAPPAPAPGRASSGGGVDMYAMPPSRLATSLGAGPSPVSAAAQAQAAQAQQAQAAPVLHQAAAAGAERRCRICATPNGPNLRYCTSCGSTLDPPAHLAAQPAQPAQPHQPRLVEQAPPAPAPAQAAPVAPAPAPFAATALAQDNHGSHPGAQPAPIAPTRVVDLGTGARPKDGPRMCNRCRGVVDAGAQFCKFCGASLAESAAAPRDSSASAPPVAPAAAPAAAALAAALASPAPAPAAPSAAVGDRAEALAAHERLELPRTNGSARPSAQHPPTIPMKASDMVEPPTPFASFPVVAQAAAPPAPVQAQLPAQAPAPVQAQAQAPAGAVARAVTRGRLVVIAKSGADGPSYPIGDTLDVGRSEGQIIVGEDPYLSPRHVRIAWTGSKLVLRDLASTNGVYIRLVAARDMTAGKAGSKAAANDDKVPGEVAVPLHDQDLILVGQQVLRFESVIAGSNGEGGFGPATEHGTLLFGSPAAPRYARLSQRTVEGVTRDVYYVRKVETVLGRESGDVVFTEDPFLSRRHAAIRVLGRDGAPVASGAKPPVDSVQFALVDLGSSNGSFLRIRNEVDLVPGDHFRVGQQLFRVDFDTDPRGRAG